MLASTQLSMLLKQAKGAHVWNQFKVVGHVYPKLPQIFFLELPATNMIWMEQRMP